MMIDLKEILAISGHPGLYKMVKHAKNSIIVESIVNGKRMPAYSTHKISALEDIAIFTNGEDAPLGSVFFKIYELEDKKQSSVSHKASSEELKAYFEKVLPEYDKDRVYVSDIKRVVQWYNVLQVSDLLKIKEEKPENTDSKEEQKIEDIEKSQQGQENAENKA